LFTVSSKAKYRIALTLTSYKQKRIVEYKVGDQPQRKPSRFDACFRKTKETRLISKRRIQISTVARIKHDHPVPLHL